MRDRNIDGDLVEYRTSFPSYTNIAVLIGSESLKTKAGCIRSGDRILIGRAFGHHGAPEASTPDKSLVERKGAFKAVASYLWA